MRAATRRDWERRADRAVESLAAGLDEPPRLEAAAAEAAASPWHFHRRFRELTGEAFASCLRRLRLERAAGRLREGRSVIEVALEAGFGRDRHDSGAQALAGARRLVEIRAGSGDQQVEPVPGELLG